jgi:hypothetical protein
MFCYVRRSLKLIPMGVKVGRNRNASALLQLLTSQSIHSPNRFASQSLRLKINSSWVAIEIALSMRSQSADESDYRDVDSIFNCVTPNHMNTSMHPFDVLTR